MANNLSFSVRLELLADKFRQQAEGAKASLRGIQFQALAMAGALGAGITSLKGLVSSLVATSREAGRARTILRTVSADAREYGQSLRFVAELAEKYGTDLIGTTDAFAKFKGAASSMGVAVAEQERIFANVSKAMASYGISGESASLTMLAITQMMSKGKISSEELRRQLGERMPIAMKAMANAAGVSISQLDKLLKEGKLKSAEIMGRFSDELAKLSGETSTDNLEASLGRLKNAFTSLTDDLHIYDHFKTAVDKVKELLDYLRSHLSNFYLWAGALLGYRLWGRFSSAFGEATALLRASQAKAIADDAEAKRRAQQAAQAAQKALADADARIARAEAALAAGNAPTSTETQRVASATNRGNARFASAVASFSKAQEDYRKLNALHATYLRGLEEKELAVAARIASAKTALATATASGDAKTIRTAQNAYDRVLAESSRLHAANNYKREKADIDYAFRANELQKRIAATGQALNQAQHERKELLAKAHAQNEEARLKRLAQLSASLDRERAAKTSLAPASVSRSYAAQWNVNRSQQNIQGALAGGLSLRPADITGPQGEAAAATISLWTRTTTTFKLLWTSAVASVRSVMSSLVPLAIIGAITAIVTKLVDWYNKQKEINGLQAKYRNDLEAIRSGHSEESQKLLRLYDTYKSLHGKVDEQKAIQHQIERSLGLQEGALDRLAGKYDNIRDIIARTIKIKDLERQADFLTQTGNDSRGFYNNLRKDYLKDHPNASLPQASLDAVAKAIAGTGNEQDRQEAIRRLKAKYGDKWSSYGSLPPETANVASLRANGRELSSGERQFVQYIQSAGFTNQTWDEAVAQGKILVQSNSDLEKNQQELAEAIVSNTQTLKQNGINVATGSVSADEEGTKKAKKSPLQRARESAQSDIFALQQRHAAGIFKSEAEYRLALDASARSHREALASFLGVKAATDAQYQALGELLLADRDLYEAKHKSATQLKDLAERVRLGIASEDELRQARAERAKTELETAIASGKVLDLTDEWVQTNLQILADVSAIAELQREYNKSTDQLAREREAGLLTEKEYREALLELIQATRRRAANTDTPTQGEQDRKKEFNDKLKQDSQRLAPDFIPQRRERNTTFDYKKTEVDKKKEERNLLSEYIAQLERAKKAGLDVGKALEEAQKQAKTLEQGITMAELEQDLKKYQEALRNKTVEGMKTVAQSARNLKSAFDGLKKAFDPEENASAWERFFAIFDSASQGIDTILSLISMMKELDATKKAVHAVEKAIAAEQIAQNTAVLASEATTTTTEVGLSATRTAATVAETKADTVGAAAKVAKAHSALPFVGVAIAGAMIGALIATIASSSSKIPKFAGGGIVPGGDGSGDRVLARVNPGELILNKAQQGRLANHLTSASSLRVEVEGRIRARDILQLSTNASRHKSRF